MCAGLSCDYTAAGVHYYIYEHVCGAISSKPLSHAQVRCLTTQPSLQIFSQDVRYTKSGKKQSTCRQGSHQGVAKGGHDIVVTSSLYNTIHTFLGTTACTQVLYLRAIFRDLYHFPLALRRKIDFLLYSICLTTLLIHNLADHLVIIL